MASKTEKTVETVKATAQTAIDQGKAAFEQAGVRAREVMDRSVKSIEEMNDFNRGNVEAFVQAGKAAGGHQSIEWTVRLESGQTISVIQASPVFAVGQRVQVIGGGTTTRLAAA